MSNITASLRICLFLCLLQSLSVRDAGAMMPSLAPVVCAAPDPFYAPIAEREATDAMFPDSIPWTSMMTGDNHTILIGADVYAAIDSVPIEPGDLIGFFYEDNGVLRCSNFITWEGMATGRGIYGNDADPGSGKNGFDEGELIQVRLYKTSTAQEFAATAEYAPLVSPISHTDRYAKDGISMIVAITATMNDILNPDCNSITVEATVQADTCQAGTGAAIIEGINAGVAFSVEWQNGQDGNQIEGLSNGTYEAILTTDNGCTLPLSLDVPPADCPLLQAGATANGAPGGAQGCVPFAVNFADASVAEAGIQAYSWDFGDGNTSDQPSPVHTYQHPGVYIVTFSVSDPYRTVTQSFEVIVHELPAADWNYEPDICTPNNIRFSAAGTGDIQLWAWSFQDGSSGTGSSPSVTFAVFDTLFEGSLQIEDANGCVQTILLEFLIPEAYDLTIVADSSTAPSCAVANGSIGLSAAGGAAPYTYQWPHDTGLDSPVANSLPAGAYAITISDANGCSEVLTIVLTDETSVPEPVLDPNIGFCADAVQPLNPGLPSGNFRWLLNGELIPGATGPDYLPLQSGTYSVEATNADGCTGTAQTLVVIHELPSVDIGDQWSICEGETSFIGVTALPGYLYAWSNGSLSAMIEVAQSGMYSLIVTDDNGCSGSDSTVVEVLSAVEAFISASSDQLCPGDTLRLIGSGAADLRWIDAGILLADPTLPEISFVPQATATYGLIASNDCFSDTTYREVIISERLVSLSPDTCIAQQRNATLSAEGAATYQWWNADFSATLGNGSSIVVSPDSTGYFYIETTDSLGCRYLDSILVEVLRLSELDLPAVNIITPNGDGFNDVLEFPNITKFDAYKLTVFNRHGAVVYESVNYQNDWDGTRNGKPLPDGVYFYILRIGQLELKSTLTIIRD
ncbi:MAG: gliding motility-associated C-terminal domain-containing protein [Saprospiraceae bacterium]|nr:gliding motility-associated C-terminal domain-containing protein [Saprospiraceae bacterium]